MALVVGLDIGGSWVRAALADADASVLRKASSPIKCENSDCFLSQLEAMAKEVAGDHLREVESIGVGMAGRLDIKAGTLVYSPHSCLKSIPVRDALEEKLGKKVVMINDNAAAAIAEKSIGAGRSHDSIVYVGIGTGIGGGAIVDGKLLLGKDGNAHEMGHMIIDIEGKLECCCGGRGHWEAYTSGSGIPNFARLLARDFPVATPLLDKLNATKVSAKELFEYKKYGDKFSCHVLDQCTKINAQALANLVDLYDPSLISIGGGVALKNAENVISPLPPYLREYAFNRAPDVVASPLGEAAPLFGAIAIALDPNII
jgi:glucokinase